jgi:hypothetical protein
MRSFARTVSASLAVSAALVPGASATMLLPVSLTELVTRADAIAHGRIVAVEARMVDGRRSVARLVTLAVADYYKGNLGSDVQVRVPGGELGHYRTVTVGAPEFTIGEEVVLFLVARGAADPVLAGLGQGVFRVRVDPQSGARVVGPIPGTPWSSGAGSVARGDVDRRPIRLDRFASELRQMAAGAGRGPAGGRR